MDRWCLVIIYLWTDGVYCNVYTDLWCLGPMVSIVMFIGPMVSSCNLYGPMVSSCNYGVYCNLFILPYGV